MLLSRMLCAWSCCAAMLVGPLVCAAGEVPGRAGCVTGPMGGGGRSPMSSPAGGAPHGGNGGVAMPGASCADAKTAFAAAAESGTAEAHFRLAETLTRAGHLDAALATYTLAIAISPDHEGALMGRWRLCERFSMHRQALKDLSRLIEIRPGKAEYHYERGRTLLKLRSVREAFRDFQRAHELDRRYPRPTLLEDEAPAVRPRIAQGLRDPGCAAPVRACRT